MIKTGISLLTDKEKFFKLIQYTQKKTGFSEYLLEKDYYLTILLNLIASSQNPLVFKGGTCLNKCHLGFYRLSEDLDFIYLFQDDLPNRTVRSKNLQGVESLMSSLVAEITGLQIVNSEKFNSNQQLRINYKYDSVFGGESTIRFEVTYHYPLELIPVYKPIQNFFTHPFSEEPILPSSDIRCMALEECVSEKIRACLTRRNPAIRDYFDIWYMRTIHKTDFSNSDQKSLIGQKLLQSEGEVDIEKYTQNLKKQIKRELSPTLAKKFDFDLEDTITFVKSFSSGINK